MSRFSQSGLRSRLPLLCRFSEVAALKREVRCRGKTGSGQRGEPTRLTKAYCLPDGAQPRVSQLVHTGAQGSLGVFL
jgi:hypothetical protein